MWTGSTSDPSEYSRKVSRYSTTGWTHDLPDLNIARSYHACSFYTTDSGDNVGFTAAPSDISICGFQVLLVTGGLNDGGKLASTEIYKNNVWSVLPSAALPSPTSLLSAGKIDDTIFLIGKNLHRHSWKLNQKKKL